MASGKELFNNAVTAQRASSPWALVDPIIYQQKLSKQQQEESDKLKKELDATDVTYTRPDEISQNVNSAKMLANQGLPSAQRQAAEQDIMRTQNFAVNAASERGGGLNAISNIQQSTGDMYRNLASMDAQQRLQNIQNLQNQQALAATYADKEYELNVYQPFMRKLQSMQDLKGASIQNQMGALNYASNTQQQMLGLGMQATGQGVNFGGGGQQAAQPFSFTPQPNSNFSGINSSNQMSSASPAIGPNTLAGGYIQ